MSLQRIRVRCIELRVAFKVMGEESRARLLDAALVEDIAGKAWLVRTRQALLATLEESSGLDPQIRLKLFSLLDDVKEEIERESGAVAEDVGADAE